MHRFAQGVSDIQARKQQSQQQQWGGGGGGGGGGGAAQRVDTYSQQMDLQGAMSAGGLEMAATGGGARQWEGAPSASNQPTFLGERLKRLSRSTNNSVAVSIEDAVMSMPFDDDLLEPGADAQNLLVEAMARHRRKQSQRQGEACFRDGRAAAAAAAGGAGQGGSSGAQGVQFEDRAPGSEVLMPSGQHAVTGASGGLFGSAAGTVRVPSGTSLSHAQLSSLVGLNFDWDVYNSVFTSSSEEGHALSLLEEARRPSSLGNEPPAATRTTSSPRLDSPPEVVANDSLWARIVREAAATAEHTGAVAAAGMPPAAAPAAAAAELLPPAEDAGMMDAQVCAAGLGEITIRS